LNNFNTGNFIGAGFVVTATVVAAIYESVWIAPGVAFGAVIYWYIFMLCWQEIIKKPKYRTLYAIGLILISIILIGYSIWDFYRWCHMWFYFYEPWC